MTFTYTHSNLDLDSTLVEEAYYNDRNQQLAVVLSNGWGYTYSGVPFSQWQAFVNATSPGGFYNTSIKRLYGPGDPLGYVSGYDEFVEAPKVAATGTPNAWTYSPDAVVTVTNNYVDLARSEPKAQRTYTVNFEADGVLRNYSLHADGVSEAVEEVHKIAGSLDMVFNVKSVTVFFE